MEPAQIPALPIDKLALAVLRDFKNDGGWNSYNWMNFSLYWDGPSPGNP
jgi:hypothetical protein